MKSFPPFACPVCKGSAFDDDLACVSCGHAVQVLDDVPVLVRDFEKLSDQIEEARQSDRTEWYSDSHDAAWKGPYRHHLQKRVNLVRDYLKTIISARSERPVLLDMGCGDGGNFFWLSQLGADLYGSDYNLLRLGRARRREMANGLALADILDYPVADNSIDIVFFNHVLEHIPDDERALTEVYRILKKGGTCVLGVPNEGVFWWQLAYKLEPDSLRTTDHVHFYTAKALAKKIEAAGFRIEKTHHVGWGLPHWSLDCRVRGYKILDDLFEAVGRVILPTQASSLYFFLRKE